MSIMRIAFLCKRQYMSKDVIVDRYARLYEIPFQLARLGHSISAYCLSYQGHEQGEWQHAGEPGNLIWQSASLDWKRWPSALNYPRSLLRRLREFKPDVLMGASDIPHVVLSAWLARRLHVPYAVDLYDNFEGFGQARIPGMIGALRLATRSADLVTTTSDPLRDLVLNDYSARGEVVSMPSTVDVEVFKVREKLECRKQLNLPEAASLIGTAGGLQKAKGVDALYTAWSHIAEQRPDAHLVLAGPVDKHYPPPFGPRVHYLGMLTHAHTAILFNALDVGIIYLRDTIFGRYCFPQKAYEMMACGLPIAAASVGVMPSLLATAHGSLYEAENPDSLARAVLAQLDRPVRAEVRISDWKQVVAELDSRLQFIVGRSKPDSKPGRGG